MSNFTSTDAEVKMFVASLYMDNKTPSEQFGLTWEQLSEFEEKNPELTCKSNHIKPLKTA